MQPVGRSQQRVEFNFGTARSVVNRTETENKDNFTAEPARDRLPSLPMKKFASVLADGAVRSYMPVQGLTVIPSSRHRSPTLVLGCPIAAVASRTLAAVILKGAPPLRPRARADAKPPLVRSEMSSRSNSAFCREPQNSDRTKPLRGMR
jgi:hypothetical protein